jgi:hypothetical protein
MEHVLHEIDALILLDYIFACVLLIQYGKLIDLFILSHYSLSISLISLASFKRFSLARFSVNGFRVFTQTSQKK